LKKITSVFLLLVFWGLLNAQYVFSMDQYDYVWAYENGLAQYEKNGKLGLLDSMGMLYLSQEQVDALREALYWCEIFYSSANVQEAP